MKSRGAVLAFISPITFVTIANDHTFVIHARSVEATTRFFAFLVYYAFISFLVKSFFAGPVTVISQIALRALATDLSSQIYTLSVSCTGRR
jgi:hypothetical protein